MANDDSVAKKMAQMIRQGAILTQYTCPVCGTPLLRLRSGKYYCAKCDREVVVVKSDEEEKEVTIRYGLITIRDSLFLKVLQVAKEMGNATDVDDINRYAATLTTLLNAMSIVNKLINEHAVGEEGEGGGH